MYVETDPDCFDPNDPYSIGEVADCLGFPQALQDPHESSTFEQTMGLHEDVHSNMENCYENNENDTHLMQGMIHDGAATNHLDNQALALGNHQAPIDNNWSYAAQNFDNGPPIMLPDGQIPMIAPTLDLLDLFHNLPPRSSAALLQNQPIPSLIEPIPMGVYDPLLHLAPHPPPPLMRDLFHSLPHGCYRGTSSLFGDGGDDDGGLLYHQNHHQETENGMLKFSQDINVCLGNGRERKATKHFTTDKEKRSQMNDKFAILMSLIPNPIKTDRASVVGEAIEYIKELLRTVDELKLLVEKKRCGMGSRRKRHRMEDGDMESCITDKPISEPDQSYSSALRSSWLQRKSKVTEVDVRIIDDEVTIKLVQRKKINCLLYVSRVLDELHLDLQHVAGGHIGEHYSFLFNSKIYEGSPVFASAIASKLIEAVDGQYAMSCPTGSY
ncbi:transcription factor bHLH91-like [Punica granatum]|uniref:Transcription factor bHLH91-like n=1 Tax=Punica granatum TaxID=22663 RepID=A0A218XGJ8_PUNGR|nr:transcription factor bHLH91-like [Punica granatum]XP_031391653.1 transcription factor bHLH91-like [Punica granatum]OWM83591.1 hypothetical protein CDL15_Pgr004020 [Punica granatum]